MPAFTMRALGSRAGLAQPGAADTPGPLAYHPQVKSRFGGGQIGDSPNFSCGKKDEGEQRTPPRWLGSNASCARALRV